MVGGNLNSGIFSHTVYGQLRERKVCASYVQTPNLEIEDVLGRVQSKFLVCDRALKFMK